MAEQTMLMTVHFGGGLMIENERIDYLLRVRATKKSVGADYMLRLPMSILEAEVCWCMIWMT